MSKTAHKTMPEEARQQLSQVERIKAHFDDGYFLEQEDEQYLEQIDIAFRVVYAEENQRAARAKIKRLFPDLSTKEIGKLIEDATFVYADFFDITKKAMRIIQEKRYNRLYELCIRNDEYGAAERVLGKIDKLHDLYSPDKGSMINARLPIVRRTNNPAALSILTHDEEE